MIIDTGKPHFADYGIVGALYYTLPDHIWEYCRSMIETVDGKEWTEIPIENEAVISELADVIDFGVKSADLVLMDDDLSCWLCVVPDVPEECRLCEYHPCYMDDAYVFDLGIVAEIPESWKDSVVAL